VYFNGKLLKTINPSSNQLESQSLDIKLDSFSTNVELKFCGASTSKNGNYGAILTKVEFWGEGKSYLRKQDPILDSYHSLPLRERRARLLQTTTISESTWSEKPSSFKTDQIIKNGWNSNSICSS
jgi:hypothetical protein